MNLKWDQQQHLFCPLNNNIFCLAGGEGDDVQGLRLHRLHAVLPLQVAGPPRQVHQSHQEVRSRPS